MQPSALLATPAIVIARFGTVDTSSERRAVVPMLDQIGALIRDTTFAWRMFQQHLKSISRIDVIWGGNEPIGVIVTTPHRASNHLFVDALWVRPQQAHPEEFDHHLAELAREVGVEWVRFTTRRKGSERVLTSSWEQCATQFEMKVA